MCYESNNDGSISLDIHWEQEDTAEIISLLSDMKDKDYFSNGCTVCLFNNKRLLEHISTLCDVNSIEYYTSYYADGICEDEISPLEDFCVLTGDDILLEDSFVAQSGNHIRVIQRQLKNVPSDNQILYLMTSDRVIGYIALTKQYENIWDVAYIYIDENYQNRGYGTFLCKKARQVLHEQNRIIFYSYCASIGSEKVAQKSGLKACAQRYIFQTDFEGLGE